MKLAAIRWLCRFLVASMALMPFSGAYAGMISTQDMAGTASTQMQRAHVTSLLERSDVASRLQALGVDLGSAKARVAAMTDEEVRTLAGQIDTLPAGAKSGSFWWAVAIAVVIAIYIVYRWR